MNDEIYFHLGPLVKQRSIFLALQEYAKGRIDVLHQDLENCSEDRLKTVQGQIKELRLLINLDKEVEQKVRYIKNGKVD